MWGLNIRSVTKGLGGGDFGFVVREIASRLRHTVWKVV